MFQFTRLSLARLYIQQQCHRLPYSGISGSMLVLSSPKHFVACYALLRLWVPRYPPYALSFLNLAAQGRLKELLNIQDMKASYQRP